MSHTPGPWKVSAHGYDSPYLSKAFIEAEIGGCIAGLWAGDCADAKLIAAAPDLLSVAQFIVQATTGNIPPGIVQAARDAIVKATL